MSNSVKDELVRLLGHMEYQYCESHSIMRENVVTYLMQNGVMVQEWISIEAGELQNYIGVPVCIKRKTDGECWWAIIRGIKGDKVLTDYGGYFKLSEYGETWIVKYLPLPQPPKGE